MIKFRFHRIHATWVREQYSGVPPNALNDLRERKRPMPSKNDWPPLHYQRVIKIALLPGRILAVVIPGKKRKQRFFSARLTLRKLTKWQRVELRSHLQVLVTACPCTRQHHSWHNKARGRTKVGARSEHELEIGSLEFSSETKESLYLPPHGLPRSSDSPCLLRPCPTP